MQRLRDVWTEERFNVKLRLHPDPEIVEAPKWVDVQNLLSRFRPIYLDTEDISFRSMLRVLARHIGVNPPGKTLEELERRWDEVLDGTTAPVPAGTHTIGPGFTAVSQEEGRLEILFGGSTLTGREALDLSVYGELVHVDAAKERKRLHIQASFVEAGYRLAVMAVISSLVYVADTLRVYAEAFIATLDPATVKEIEAEVDPHPAGSY